MSSPLMKSLRRLSALVRAMAFRAAWPPKSWALFVLNEIFFKNILNRKFKYEVHQNVEK